MDPVEITFESSGGYGGLFAKKPLVYRAKMDDLPDSVRSELLALLDASRLLERDDPGGRKGPQRDAVAYRLAIHTGPTVRSFEFDDATAPPEVRPLLGRLQQLAIESRARGR